MKRGGKSTSSGQKLPPGICSQVLAVKNVLDNIKLRLDLGRVSGCAVALQCSNDLARFVVFALADQ
jgi:hypothetical protein